MASNKPGVMIYFETGRAIKGLDYETKGRLFEAIMEYAEHGTDPSFDGVLAAVWPFIANGIDRDSVKYADTVTKRKRAAYAKWWEEYAKEHGIDPKDKTARDRWIDMQMHAKDANASDAMQMMPTTTPTITSTPTPTPAPTPTPTTTSTPTGTTAGVLIAGAESPTHAYGSFGRYNNVYLTDKEYNELLMSIPNVEGVIERLSEYIKSTGKHYESHEATIRKWAREDEEKRTSKQSAQQPRQNSGNAFLGLVEGGLV